MRKLPWPRGLCLVASCDPGNNLLRLIEQVMPPPFLREGNGETEVKKRTSVAHAPAPGVQLVPFSCRLCPARFLSQQSCPQSEDLGVALRLWFTSSGTSGPKSSKAVSTYKNGNDHAYPWSYDCCYMKLTYVIIIFYHRTFRKCFTKRRKGHTVL